MITNTDNDNLPETEDMSPSTNIPKLKPPTCLISQLAGISLISYIPLLFFSGIIKHNEANQWIFKYIAYGMMFSIIGSPLLAIIALIRITLSKQPLAGMRLAFLVLVLSFILIMSL
jgi:hypothetical protein